MTISRTHLIRLRMKSSQLDLASAQVSYNRKRWKKAGIEPNSFTGSEWLAMQEACGYRCHYCGIVTQEDLTIDHVIRFRERGGNIAGNIVPACRDCNTRRH